MSFYLPSCLQANPFKAAICCNLKKWMKFIMKDSNANLEESTIKRANNILTTKLEQNIYNLNVL